LARADVPSPERWADWVAALRERDRQREVEIDEQAAVGGDYVNPLALLRILEVEAADSAVFVADGGDFVATASYVLRPRGPLSWLDPGAFGTLGVGAGFALGTALARPDREVWIDFGDGACGWGLCEFDSFVRQGVPVIALVGNDAGWTQIAREQIKMLHDDVATGLARSSYHDVVAGFGARGLQVQRLEDVRPALAQARTWAAMGHAVLVNVWLDKTQFREGSLSMYRSLATRRGPTPDRNGATTH
jgi:acetolactate synthase-1/2/3 large subunit